MRVTSPSTERTQRAATAAIAPPVQRTSRLRGGPPPWIGNQAVLSRGAAGAPAQRHAAISAEPAQLSRKCNACETEEETLRAKPQAPSSAGTAPQSVRDVLRSPGRALDPASRALFEPHFGSDFSAVRVHTDQPAADSAAAVRARAYTVGRHIVFNRAQYAPDTEPGRRLLAHELTHVMQQRDVIQQDAMQQASGGCPNGAPSLPMGSPGDRFESEAEAHEAAFAAGVARPTQAVQVNAAGLRLSGAWESCGDVKDCPKRDQGEVAAKATFAVGELVTPESGEIVHGFAVGSSATDGLAKDPTWLAFAAGIASSADHWEILGFSDCEGGVELNGALRDLRAQTILGLLPAAAQPKIDRAAGAPLTDCVAGNDSAANRAYNRAVVFRRTVQSTTIPDETIKVVKCPPASPAAVSNLGDYVSLLRCAEKAMGLGPREMLAVYRQIYYGKDWSVSTSSNWDNVITCSPAVGDPRPKLGVNLFGALKASQEVGGVDVGHVFTGLEAATCPTPTVSFFGGLATVAMSNEDFATWGGDLGAACAAHVACPQLGADAAKLDDCGNVAGPHPIRFYYDLSAPPQDLEGDIDAFVVRANLLGIPCKGSAQRKFTPTRAMSEVFDETYLDPTSSLGTSHANRYQCMLEVLGATLSGKRITNRPAVTAAIVPHVTEFAEAFYVHLRKLPTDNFDEILLRTDSDAVTDIFLTYLETEMRKSP